MKKIQYLILMGFITLLYFACKAPKTTVDNSSMLLNTQWIIQKINNDNVALANGQQEPLLTFVQTTQGSSFRGYVGCNRFFGSINLDGNKITFSNIGKTKMYCAHNKYEEPLLDLLLKVTEYEIKNNQLLLKQNKLVVVTLSASIN